MKRLDLKIPICTACTTEGAWVVGPDENPDGTSRLHHSCGATDQFRYDTRDVTVPARWTEFAFEYKEGYRSASRVRVWNPVRGNVMGGRPRDAWRAGREAALRAALTSP
jgi:hypothetical protein